jgi:hypothetical protein
MLILQPLTGFGQEIDQARISGAEMFFERGNPVPRHLRPAKFTNFTPVDLLQLKTLLNPAVEIRMLLQPLNALTNHTRLKKFINPLFGFHPLLFREFRK